MAFVGNGITFSMLGATVLHSAFSGKRDPLSRLFQFRYAHFSDRGHPFRADRGRDFNVIVDDHARVLVTLVWYRNRLRSG